jgi:Cu/Ag efflux protein CusF
MLMTATAFAALVATSVYAQSVMVDSRVTKIAAPANKIALKHDPLKKFDMDEPITMVFRVQGPEMLKAVKVGDKVKFDADKVNGQFTVTKIEKSK